MSKALLSRKRLAHLVRAPSFGAMHKENSSPGSQRAPQASPDALPEDVSGLAVFLDIDGTLLDIAETPDGVIVSPGLTAALTRMSHRLDGALALVTGRSIDMVDRLFQGMALPVSGLHGAEWRDDRGRVMHATTPAFERAKCRLRRQAASWPGAVFEDKGAAFALHYRLAPRREPHIRGLMAELAEAVGTDWVRQDGKDVVELRPRGRDKGDALMAFMELDAFCGRRPLTIGDDVTDEAMFAAANRLGGLSVRVGKDGRSSLAKRLVASPSDVRAWIERITT